MLDWLHGTKSLAGNLTSFKQYYFQYSYENIDIVLYKPALSYSILDLCYCGGDTDIHYTCYYHRNMLYCCCHSNMEQKNYFGCTRSNDNKKISQQLWVYDMEDHHALHHWPRLPLYYSHSHSECHFNSYYHSNIHSYFHLNAILQQ